MLYFNLLSSDIIKEGYALYVMSITKQLLALIYEVHPFWKKFLSVSSSLCCHLLQFCSSGEILGIHVSYLNHFKSFSIPATCIFTHFSLDKNKQPLLAISHKVNFQITIFQTIQSLLIPKIHDYRLDIKYFKFHHLSSCKLGQDGFHYFYHPLKIALAI